MTHNHRELPIKLSEVELPAMQLLCDKPKLKAFSSDVLTFIKELSKRLLTDKHLNMHPEIVALGFWLRESNIKRLEINYASTMQTMGTGILFQKPLGAVMHICPSNVDTMFVYSWVCSLLVGNNNIVRVSTADTEVKRKILQCLTDVFSKPEYAQLRERNLIATWEQDSSVSAGVSKMVQGRVIWGGDDTVQKIRACLSKPGCRDICFADKFSVAIVNLVGLQQNAIPALSEMLWRDINTFNQAACSSPKILVFCGQSPVVKEVLISELSQYASQMSPGASECMDFLVTQQLLQSKSPDNTCRRSNGLILQRIDKLDSNYISWHPARSFLYEFEVDNISQLFQQIPEKCQTVSHFGFSDEELAEAIALHSQTALDRVVPIGQALNFSENWDGFDVLKQLSRVIELVT